MKELSKMDADIEGCNGYCEIRKTKNGKDTILDVYLYNDIEDCQYYIDLMQELNKLDHRDLVNIHINSCGGYTHVGFQIVHALQACEAPVVAYLDGFCYSAASMIMLGADGWQLTPYSRVMCHSWTGGNYGKAHEVEADHAFNAKWLKERTEELYYPFLNKKEIKDMLKGQDFWFDAEETSKRLDKVIEYRKKQMDDLEDDD